MSQNEAELVRAEETLSRGIERAAPPIAKIMLARVRVWQHRYSEALELAREFIAESPENSSQLFDIVSAVWRSLRRGDNPADLLEFCYGTLLNLARDPEHCTPELESSLVDEGLSLIEAKIDQPAIAILDYFRRPENRGRDSYYYAIYALALKELRDGKLVSARLLLLEIVEAQTCKAGMACQEFQGLSPIRANAYSVMIETYRRGGHPPPTELIADALQSFPDDPILLNTIAVALEEAEQSAEAVECYRRALVQQPYFLTAHFNLIDCLASGRRRGLEQEGAFAQAVENFAGRIEEMLALAATNPAAVYRLDTKEFFTTIINLYCQTNYEPLLDLLQRVLAAKTPYNLKARFSASLAERSAQKGRKGRIPQSLRDLAIENGVTV
jgi:tetratricopeptide (TPR) repeat protein